MSRNILKCIAVIFFRTVLSGQELVIYDPPGEIIYKELNDDFTVKVKNCNDNQWKDLYEYNVKVDMDHVRNASMVSFDFSGSVDIIVKVNNMDVNSVLIRPLSLNIKPKLKGNIISFSLSKACKLSLEVNGDKYHNLHIFANPLLRDIPDPNDPNVIYFGPGVYYPDDTVTKAFIIPSGKTVYIDGSALLRGKIVCDRVKDVHIVGRGIIDRPYRGIEVTHSENVEIDGIIIRNPQHYSIYGGQSNHLTIRNMKSFSCESWSDGIDLMCCSDVIIDDVFMRNSDDCIAVYAHRWDFYGNARNYNITNSVLWADIAHPTNIGLHGNGNGQTKGDSIENITFSNIDILEHDEDDPNYQGCLAISAGDNNLIRNITYENVRIEDIQEGQILNFRVYFNEKYCSAPGRSVQNITLKNISYYGSFINPSYIGGYDNERKVEELKIENLSINGKKIKKANNRDLIFGDYVDKIEFVK